MSKQSQIILALAVIINKDFFKLIFLPQKKYMQTLNNWNLLKNCSKS